MPVYQIAKRGGNKKLTLVRHIDGSRDALAARLAHALGLPRKEVKINPVTGHVVVAVRSPPPGGLAFCVQHG